MPEPQECGIDAQRASMFAQRALVNIRQELPNKPDHVITGVTDLRSPRERHPAFYGSYDWHSSVHMHWLLAHLLHLLRPADLPERDLIRNAFNQHFTPENIGAELAYMQQPSRRSFERTYGWAWLLKLQSELHGLTRSDEAAVAWRDALQPLADAIIEGYLHFLPLAQYPVRAGTHANSAFGLLFALDYAECIQHLVLRKLIAAKANTWFGHDRRYPAGYEPGGDDFLSAGLMEAALMLRVTDSCSYVDWWELFRPAPHELQTWLSPVQVTDRSDPKLAHLDGVNLSRAWCWKMIRPQLDPTLRERVDEAIDAHLDASLPFAADGDYAGTHWLACFALLALTEG